MSSKLTRSVVPIIEICPECEGEMRITEVTPTLFADGLEESPTGAKGVVWK
jgi:hypothetical protein